MRVAFLACCERGPLEMQTLLLCRSLRRYGGRFADAAIYTFQPREGTAISEETLAGLRELGVVHSDVTLNREFAHYPIGNKVFVSAYAEETLGEDVLVFVDSDTVFVDEPSELALDDAYDAAATPANKLNTHLSTGPGDPNDGYWRGMYALLSIEHEPYLESVVDRVRLRAYFSTGLIAARRSAGVFRQWRDDFLRLVRAGHMPLGNIGRMDELSFAATAARDIERVLVLDHRYNYPIPQRVELVSPLREAQLEELVHVHYRKWFARPDYLRLVQPPLDQESAIVRWLDGFLPFEPLNYRTVPGTENETWRAS